jgi:hypothetical protein
MSELEMSIFHELEQTQEQTAWHRVYIPASERACFSSVQNPNRMLRY